MSGFENLTNLKLRAGYGVSGSDNTSNYQALSRVGNGDDEVYVFNGGAVPGATIVRLGNAALSWEEIEMLNFGIDAGFYDGRLNFTAEYYEKSTKGLLLPFAPAFEAGAIQNPTGNLGEVSNKGFEFSVNSINVMKDKFRWTTDFNFATVQNEIISLPEDADRFNGVNISRVGEEIGALYGFETDGIFQNWDEVYSHALQNQSIDTFDDDGNPIYSGSQDQNVINNNTAPGDLRFVDQNGDGFVEAENDRVILGSTIPDFTWGLTNNFTLGGFDISILLQGVHGVDAFNGLRVFQERSIGSWGNSNTRVLQSWSGEGSTNEVFRAALTDPNSNQRTSDYWVEDASFVRIKNVRVAYSPPSKVMNQLGMGGLSASVYLVGTNLFTFTEYSGFDPEIGLRNGNNPETAGFDNGGIPLTRQVTMGVRLSF